MAERKRIANIRIIGKSLSYLLTVFTTIEFFSFNIIWIRSYRNARLAVKTGESDILLLL